MSDKGNCCSSAPPFEQRTDYGNPSLINCHFMHNSIYHFLLDHLAKESPGSRLQRHPKPCMLRYSSLELAAKNFSENNILEEGRLGHIYQSCFDGVLAAVMKLDGCGQDFERMFDNELDFLVRIENPNIVSLLGYCIHGEITFLVYKLLQNGSLETQLHGFGLAARGGGLNNGTIELSRKLDNAAPEYILDDFASKSKKKQEISCNLELVDL
ncbi:hypothetical protein IEQ34_006079 [Dendrobium chrysotoxum]|uniref:non-specific serine/threonine protein kinase n=1 Tax=Dendrobium chrysotoxum TaxID=161865 RepID=A0AAV7HAC8_DENCH|nr:hypothetical protein IEQ34_006079 [Dendrobium chrysotoxum]